MSASISSTNISEKDADDIALFQGSSCFPMSPNQLMLENPIVIDEDDQLNKIIDKVGPICETSMEFLDSEG